MARSTVGGVTVGVIASCAVGWNITNVGAIAGTVADAYGISLASVGLFTTALFLAHLSMQVPGGRLADRFGARLTCAAGVAVMAAGLAVSMIAPDPVLGMASRALTGIGTGLSFVAGTAYIRAIGGSPFAQGMYGGLGLGAGGLALAVVPWLVPQLSWRAPYLSALVLALIALLAFAFVPSGDRPAVADDERTPLISLAKDRRLYRLAFVYSCTFGLSVVLSNWVVELLERHGLSQGTASLAGGLILLLGVISRPFGGWVMRSRPHLTRRAVGFGIALGGLGAVLLAVSAGPLTAFAGGTLLGIGGGVAFAPTFTGSAVLRPDAPATSTGFVNSTASATILLCTPLVGLTFSLPGAGRIGFLLAAAIWVAALAVLPPREALGVPAPQAPANGGRSTA